jgi:hypothetical protein
MEMLAAQPCAAFLIKGSPRLAHVLRRTRARKNAQPIRDSHRSEDGDET